jgi:hypothetical protein
MSLSKYKSDLQEIESAAKNNGVDVNFFQGTWGAREVAYFLGVAYSSVINRKAGLSNLPAMRMGKSVRYVPNDVIEFREQRHREAIRRTPQSHITRLRKVS